MLKDLPLNKANRLLIARAFKGVPRVDMSIDCVVEGQMGKAIVDHAERPSAIKLVTGPFIYFAGDAQSLGGQEMLAGLAPYTLLMPSAPGWVEAAKALYQEKLIGFDRYSFSGEGLSVEQLDALIERSGLSGEVRQMDLDFAERLWGQDHFVDLSEFDSPEDFVGRGIGFYMEADGEVIGAAYSSLVCSRGIEVSLFVEEKYRRRGVATAISASLLRWCMENNAQANWDAANPESCRLAVKLGYRMLGSYQAYYLRG